jgi:hypothetical protein
MIRNRTEDLAMSLDHDLDRQGEETVPLTLSVPEAGWRFYGLGRNGSYQAAKRGDLVTVRVGRLLRVPVAAQQRKLDRAGEAA